jgi:hypothetical protein
VLAKLLEHPLAHHGMSGRVVEDVDLPKAQQNLATGASDVYRSRRASRMQPWHAVSVSLSDIGFNNIVT